MLKCHNIGAVDTITSQTSENSRNSVFKSKETTNEVPRNIFRDFKKTKSVRLIF